MHACMHHWRLVGRTFLLLLLCDWKIHWHGYNSVRQARYSRYIYTCSIQKRRLIRSLDQQCIFLLPLERLKFYMHTIVQGDINCQHSSCVLETLQTSTPYLRTSARQHLKGGPCHQNRFCLSVCRLILMETSAKKSSWITAVRTECP